MVEVRQTTQFSKWVSKLKDQTAKGLIIQRIHRLEVAGHYGDAKRFDGIGELRIKYGPGYRVYFTEQDGMIVILLCGGDKGSQKRDIKRAKDLAEDL